MFSESHPTWLLPWYSCKNHPFFKYFFCVDWRIRPSSVTSWREREKKIRERKGDREHSGINTRRNMCERNRDREGGRREGGRGNVWREFKRTYVKNLNFFLNPSFCYGCPFWLVIVYCWKSFRFDLLNFQDPRRHTWLWNWPEKNFVKRQDGKSQESSQTESEIVR